MNHPLAVFAPFVGARSETFIRRHACDLLPGQTVVVTGEANGHYSGHWTVDGPLFALDKVPSPPLGRRIVSGIARRAGLNAPPHDVKSDVGQFLTRHGVSVALGEFLSWSLTWLRVAQRCGIPFFGHGHGFDVSAHLRLAKWREEYRCYNDSGGIITMSEFSRARLVELGIKPEKVHVIPYGVEVPSERPVHDEREIISCLAVGRMTSKKAPILLLDAFRRAASECPQLHLDYVGEGELFPAAQQFIQAFELEDRVTLHGGKSSSTVLDMMRHADLFVQHSVTDPETGDQEGLPVAILEAMANSLPVVSTRHAGIPEAVSHGTTGLLVEEGDTRSMSDCLLTLARNGTLRQSMGAAGWRVARERFTWERERADLRRILGVDAFGTASPVL